MEPRFLIESLNFSDGTQIPTAEANIIILVGPNNSGKTSTLREILKGARSSDNVGPVLKKVAFKRTGTALELKAWLDQNVQKIKLDYDPDEVLYSWLGMRCREGQVQKSWTQPGSIGDLNGILCSFIDVEKRLAVSNAQEPIDFFTEAPSHPMHVLYLDAKLEQKVNEVFRAAFNSDIVLNRGGGKVMALHVGEKPEANPGEDSTSRNYFERLRQLPFLHHQGHGMRSFVGCTLNLFSSPAFIHLIDEPEAFLHPPHAKLLASLLARSTAPNRQLVIATHSGDFLRGLLDAKPASLRVIRLTREGMVNRVHQLDSNSISTFWGDPVLRFSNVLDSIFHEGVVLCESDSDCRFYSAVLNAVLEKRGEISPDVMFAASGGKDRLPVLINALLGLGVKIRVIADFDVLRDKVTFSAIVRALGGDWQSLEPIWQSLQTNIQMQTPLLGVNQVREKILTALGEEKTASVSEQTVEKIKLALKATSPWHYAKRDGVNAMASGQPRSQLNGLLTQLRNLGLFVVECGEIERFVPSVGQHGPKWVAQALAKNIATDSELDTARAFISSVFDIGPNSGWCQPHPKSNVPPDFPSIASSASPPKRAIWRDLLKKLGIPVE